MAKEFSVLIAGPTQAQDLLNVHAKDGFDTVESMVVSHRGQLCIILSRPERTEADNDKDYQEYRCRVSDPLPYDGWRSRVKLLEQLSCRLDLLCNKEKWARDEKAVEHAQAEINRLERELGY